jgi:hypothetical protein
VKLFIEVQLVQVQPGQGRSGQAGSECCHSSGDWRVRSVHSKEAGREDSAPKSFLRCDADAVSLAEGSIRTTAMRGWPGVAGVPSPGHAFKGISREPRRSRYLSRRWAWCRPEPKTPGPMEHARAAAWEANNPHRRETCRQGRPEAAATGRREVLRPHSTDEGGQSQGSRKGRPRHPLEGRGEQANVTTQ